jgi:hypothetical protein
MSESETTSAADLEALKALQADASELERIEELLDRFNVFEVIGFVHQEVMHSLFLAFLLDPKQNHDLKASFLKRFLQKVSESANRASLPSIFDTLGEHDLTRIAVQTEVPTDDGRIDILLLDEASRWAMIIENKIRSTEHHDQLNRYYSFVKDNYPSWKVTSVYLTPFGERASHQEYLPLDYGLVCQTIDEVLEDPDSAIRSEIRMALDQYGKMVRRHILGGNFEIARLCSQVYRKHQRAMDLINEYRFAHQEIIYRLLKRLLDESPNLMFDTRESYLRPGEDSGEDYVAFVPKSWHVSALKVASEGYTESGLVLVFWFCNMPDTLDLILELAPGHVETRERLLDMAHRNRSVFEDTPDALDEYTEFFSRPMLKAEFYDRATYNECEHEIRKQWGSFLEQDLPRIEAALDQETWIWE